MYLVETEIFVPLLTQKVECVIVLNTSVLGNDTVTVCFDVYSLWQLSKMCRNSK